MGPRGRTHPWAAAALLLLLVGLLGGPAPVGARVCNTTYPDGLAFNLSCSPLEGAIWHELAAGRWELSTFHIFSTFLTCRTSYVGFGSWVGPMLVYAAHFARHAWGLEPDAIAFSRLQHTLKGNPAYAARIHAFNRGIANASGEFIMKARGQAGNSMSGLSSQWSHKRSRSWKCSTLPEFLEANRVPPPYFFKVDIEGYERSLIPSLHGWLASRTFNVTIFLSMHLFFSGPYSSDETNTFISVLRLFPYVFIQGDVPVKRKKFSEGPPPAPMKRVDFRKRFRICKECDYVLSDTLPPELVPLASGAVAGWDHVSWAKAASGRYYKPPRGCL